MKGDIESSRIYTVYKLACVFPLAFCWVMGCLTTLYKFMGLFISGWNAVITYGEARRMEMDHDLIKGDVTAFTWKT
jgi:hypothetical protein